MKKIAVSDHEEMLKAIQNFSDCEKIWLLFTGKRDASGKSWCPDCDKAEPVISQCIKDYDATHGDADNAALITIEIPRDEHKNLQNYYRTHKDIQLKCVPTLMLHGQLNMRLAEDNLTDPDLIKELLEQ